MQFLPQENVPAAGATTTGIQSHSLTIPLRVGKTLADKVVLYNFFVKSLTNSDELVKRGFLHYETGRNNCPVGDQMITKLEIHDDDENLPAEAPFHTFFYGMSRTDHFYCRMELLVNRDDGTYNLFGNTPDEIRSQVTACQEYLSAMGIDVDFFDAKLYSIEINRTIVMIGSLMFSDPEFQSIGYRALYNLPGTLRLKKDSIYKSHRCPASTFMASSVGTTGEGLTFKLYDKTAEMKKKYKFDTRIPYMRVENVISGSSKIKDTFGSNYLRDLTETMIDNYFTKFMTDNIKSSNDKLAQKFHKKMATKIKSLFNADSWHWAYNFILWLQNEETIGNGECPLLIDPDEIYTVIDSLNRGKFKNRNRKYRMKGAIKRVLENPDIGLVISKRSASYWDEFTERLCVPAEYIPKEDITDAHDEISDSDIGSVDSDSQSEQTEKSVEADSMGADGFTMDANGAARGTIVKTMAEKYLTGDKDSTENKERLDE